MTEWQTSTPIFIYKKGRRLRGEAVALTKKILRTLSRTEDLGTLSGVRTLDPLPKDIRGEAVALTKKTSELFREQRI